MSQNLYNKKVKANIRFIFLSTFLFLLSGCGLMFGLFYKDWRTETAYRSSASKKNYYVIYGVTQSHCGCSDIVVKNFKNKQKDFTFYYGGGLFPAKKYIYKINPFTNKTDTVVYTPTNSENFTIPLDSLDREILQRIDSLTTSAPRGKGLIYPVKRHSYKGFLIEK